MEYVNLGSTGLKVSQLCFGTMTFGSGFRSVGSTDQKHANEIVKRALDAGINFFDTADIYSRGEAEQVLGQALKDLEVPRGEVVIATKVRGKMSDDVNDVGLSRKHIMDSIDRSLKRLQTDHVDLYQIHGFDPATPLEETMRALADLVSSGKVRYIGCSNLAAWQLAKANAIADQHGWPRFVTHQGNYSLAGRGIEFEVAPYCLSAGMGILPWSPLAGGILTGKYHEGTAAKDARLQGELNGFIPYDPDQLKEILKVMDSVADAHEVSKAVVALAWLRYKPAVSSIIIGAKTLDQLNDNLRAAEVELSDAEVEQLDEVSRVPLPYPQWMIGFQTRDRA